MSIRTGKVLCLGEILLRICPDTSAQWIADQRLPIYIGGAELNVSRALAKWNIPVSFLSSMPDNFLATQVLQEIEAEGISTTHIRRTGNRIGLYFLPTGETIQNHGVIYDREGSSFSMLKRGEIDWASVFDGVSWFHLSAINPALSDEVAWVCEEGMKWAHANGIVVSMDLNYRPKLWKNGRDPRWVMESLLPYCSVLMGNVWAADRMVGIPVDEQFETNDRQACIDHAHRSSERIMEIFPDIRQVFNTFRFESNPLRYFATINTREEALVSSTYRTSKVEDKVGTGDCFMAGVIYSYFNGFSPQQTLDYAAAAAFQKLFTRGDANQRSAEEVVAFASQYVS